jgi:hypothetical protein
MLTMLGTGCGERRRAALAPLDSPFNVLLTDLVLPGSTATARRAAPERWPALRVIVMSGYAPDVAVRQDVSRQIRFLESPSTWNPGTGSAPRCRTDRVGTPRRASRTAVERRASRGRTGFPFGPRRCPRTLTLDSRPAVFSFS